MSISDVLTRYGTAALLRFVAAVLAFLVLHLIRIPFVLAARVLAVAMSRVDSYLTREVSRGPRGPVNHFHTPHPHASSDREAHSAYAA